MEAKKKMATFKISAMESIPKKQTITSGNVHLVVEAFKGWYASNEKEQPLRVDFTGRRLSKIAINRLSKALNGVSLDQLIVPVEWFVQVGAGAEFTEGELVVKHGIASLTFPIKDLDYVKDGGVIEISSDEEGTKTPARRLATPKAQVKYETDESATPDSAAFKALKINRSPDQRYHDDNGDVYAIDDNIAEEFQESQGFW